MDAFKPEALAERLQWEAQDYWVHIEASSPLEKYPAKQHAQAVAYELDVSEGLIYLPGARTVLLEDSDQPRPFRQRRYFYYMSGVDEPDCDLTYDIKRDELTLYIPPINPKQVIWGGRGSTIAEAYNKYDVDTVRYSTTIIGAVKKWVKHSVGYIYILHPSQALRHGDEKSDRVNYTELQRAIDSCRVVKDSHEIKLIKKANDITAKAHRQVLENIRNFKNEAQVEAIFLDTCVAEDAKQQAYEIIAASGENASTLHYVKNDEPLKGRQLMCLDAGCEWQNYASDVTRTFPLSGSWPSKEAKEIYDIVQKMQTTCIELLKPGVRFLDVHVLAHRIAVQALLELGILHNGTAEEILEAGTSLAFFPHGLGHHMGLEVHDVSGISINDISPSSELSISKEQYILVEDATCKAPVDCRSGTLEEGMVVTVEPGIYFSHYALTEMYLPSPIHSKYINKEALMRYMPIGGVRIEDDILITAKGFENLTTAPKGEEMLRIIRGEDGATTGSVPCPNGTAQASAVPQRAGQPTSAHALGSCSTSATEQMRSNGISNVKDKSETDLSPRSCGDQPSPRGRTIRLSCKACRKRRVRCQQAGTVKDGPCLRCSRLGQECSHPYTGKDCASIDSTPRIIRQDHTELQSGGPGILTDGMTAVKPGSANTGTLPATTDPVGEHPYWARFSQTNCKLPGPDRRSNTTFDLLPETEMPLATNPSPIRYSPSMYPLYSESQNSQLPPGKSFLPPAGPEVPPQVPQKPLAYRHSLPYLTEMSQSGWTPVSEASKRAENSQHASKCMGRRTSLGAVTSFDIPTRSTALPSVAEGVSSGINPAQVMPAGQLSQDPSTGAHILGDPTSDYQKQLQLLEEQCRKRLAACQDQGSLCHPEPSSVKPVPSSQASGNSVADTQNGSTFPQDYRMQVVLLERQNRKRLLIRSLEQDALRTSRVTAESATAAEPHSNWCASLPNTPGPQLDDKIESFLNPSTDTVFQGRDDKARAPEEWPEWPDRLQSHELQPRAEHLAAIQHHEDAQAVTKPAPNTTYTLTHNPTDFPAGIGLYSLHNNPSLINDPLAAFTGRLHHLHAKRRRLEHPDNRVRLAAAATTYLSADPQNRARGITGDEVCRLLDRGPRYLELCEDLEGLGLRFDRAGFAAALLEVVLDS